MMRAAFLCVLALAACAPRQQATCDFSATRDVVFTSAEATDIVSARSFGPSCDKAVGLYEIRDAEGRPIWAWAAPLAHAFADVFSADASDEVQAFLERWSAPDISTTAAAPAWDALAPGETTLDQFTYADIRARDLPMLCHFSGTARQTCVFWEPAAGGAGHLYDRDAGELE